MQKVEVSWPTLRGAILFTVGLSGVIYETVVTTSDRPSLLIMFAAMMGLPLAVAQDIKRRTRASEDSSNGGRGPSPSEDG